MLLTCAMYGHYYAEGRNGWPDILLGMVEDLSEEADDYKRSRSRRGEQNGHQYNQRTW